MGTARRANVPSFPAPALARPQGFRLAIESGVYAAPSGLGAFTHLIRGRRAARLPWLLHAAASRLVEGQPPRFSLASANLLCYRGALSSLSEFPSTITVIDEFKSRER